jgi:Saxitoxin biosynthesis operon protein SxtJ
MVKSFLNKIVPQSISKKEASDTGMAMTLICLLLGYFTKNNNFYIAAIPALVITMAFPMFYYPFAMVWLSLTNLLGAVVSRILLSIVYILILLPVGLIRRAAGKDSLNLKGFKKSTSSVMVVRDYEFTANDIKNPF